MLSVKCNTLFYMKLFCVFQPLPPDQNTVNIFKDLTVGTNVPKPFVPGVRKGFEIMAEKGDYIY